MAWLISEMLGTKWPYFDDPTYYDDPITWMHVDCANTHCCAVLTDTSVARLRIPPEDNVTVLLGYVDL